ncbi:MAG: hypothetical protein WB561_05970 [Terracidiphilus sp.]|jgi:hypothetical protein
MRNVIMIRPEPGLVSIPLEQAVYCQSCEMISTSARQRCGLCGSERIVELALFFSGPSGPGSPPAAAFAPAARLAA